MGYLAQGKPMAFFIRFDDEQLPELNRLLSIGYRTKKNRIRKKIGKRIDAMVEVEQC